MVPSGDSTSDGLSVCMASMGNEYHDDLMRDLSKDSMECIGVFVKNLRQTALSWFAQLARFRDSRRSLYNGDSFLLVAYMEWVAYIVRATR